MEARYKQIMHDRGLPFNADLEQSQQFTMQPSIFQMLSDVLQDYDICTLKQSPQQLINGLYLKVALAEARAYSMMSFAWMLLRVYNEGNFTAEQQYGEETYLQYSADILQESYSVMLKASNEFRTCDPKQHSEGETFVQITELLQGVIENEVDMNNGGTCQQNCAYYEHARSEGCFYSETQYCGSHRRCGGTLHNCGFYDADAWVCKSKNPYKRYDYILYENNVRLGPQGSCKGDQIKVDSWWRWFVHCSYCFCMCDDGNSTTTDRFVSLMPVLSDTKKNMVVTGIKFTKQRGVIHMKIQQGQALPQGQVNSTTLRWQDVEPINIKSSAYQNGVHYKKLSYEERNIDLDRLTAIESHVVTGVRFRMLGGHLNLEVQITPVNFTTGELRPFKSYWISNDNTPAMAKNPRREISVVNLDIPTRYPGSTRIDSVPDSFIRFGPSSITLDAAQSTIPFFDAQTVAPVPASWMSGVELYHKGRRGTGGFLGLQVMTYNTSQHTQEFEGHKVVINQVDY
ncbi:unnamed protein product [Meganyctiphanes norvegica]|uniref:Uncharacterized protein n=1 Tax=Meganyctiphanes norvegica TaxID=48144 RepID=A0AAV2S6D4_MEGNR